MSKYSEMLSCKTFPLDTGGQYALMRKLTIVSSFETLFVFCLQTVRAFEL